MRKINNGSKISLVTNLIIVAVIGIVLAVSFVPASIMPISGKNAVEAIYNGNRERPNVSLMFNVYQDGESVNKILDILKDHKVKATFFVGGCWADDNAKILQRIVGEGHEIANHGYYHKDHKKLDYTANREEIYYNELVVNALSGVKTELFAPPSGSFSEATLEVCYDLGYKLIMWSKDTIDWRDRDSELIYKRATEGVSNGDLILMHPYPSTVAALDRILGFYEANGLKEVTVTDNLSGK